MFGKIISNGRLYLEGGHIRFAFFVALLLAAPLSYSQDSGEKYCHDFQNGLEELNRQLPSQIDRFTYLEGGSAFYISGICTITYMYSVDSDELISLTHESLKRQGDNISRSEIIDYLNSPEGDNLMREIQERIVNNHFKDLLRGAPDIQLTIVYTAPEPLNGWQSSFYLNDL